VAIHPEINEVGFDESSGIGNVILAIPGSRYHEIEAREAAILAVISAGFVALAAIAVMRRRPR
jgi:hypothetical protein